MPPKSLVERNYYERLELTEEADAEAVKKAYRKLSRKYHPDKGGSEAEFQALGEAHDCLKEPFQRMMYDSWLKGDQSEPFNKGGFPDLSEMWAEGEGCMPKLKNAGLVLVLLLVFALMALYGIVVDWWEYVGEVCAELKRATLASFTDEDKAKMLEQMGGEEEIKAQLVLYGLLATFLGWWVGGWTWYEAEADAIEAASGWFGDGWAAWLTGWLWELLDSLGVFSLGWFDGLLPEGGLFGSSSVNMSSEEGLSAAPAATAEVSAAPEAGALDGTGVLADPDALFPDDDEVSDSLAGAAADAMAAAADAMAAAAARCGPGTMWDEDSGFCIVAEGTVEKAAAAAVAAAAAESGWFWWLSYLSPFAWTYWLLEVVLPESVMWFLNLVGLFLGCCVKWVYGCAGLMVVLWRVELSNTKPELSQGERAQYWDTCAAALAFVYCYTYEAYGMVWTLFYTPLYPYMLNSAVTKVVPFLDDIFGDERASKLLTWYQDNWKTNPGSTLVFSSGAFIVWYWATAFWVRGLVFIMACEPFYSVVTTRGENWFLWAVTIVFFAATYCYFAWGLVWACGGSLVGGWALYGLSQIPSMLREYGWSKSDDGDASPSSSPRAADANKPDSDRGNTKPSDEQD